MVEATGVSRGKEGTRSAVKEGRQRVLLGVYASEAWGDELRVVHASNQ